MCPYDANTLRSVYHIRNLDVFRLKLLSSAARVDIGLSHDWPNGIVKYGDADALLRRKPFFDEDLRRGQLGSWPAWEVLEKLRPRYWFAAHLHVKFSALVRHGEEEETRFLALDKCLPHRHFLQVLDIPDSADAELRHFEYDAEWLAILRKTDHLLGFGSGRQYMPSDEDLRATPEEIDEVRELFKGEMRVDPQAFYRSVDAYSPDSNVSGAPPVAVINRQTSDLCARLGIRDPLAEMLAARDDAGNPDEIDIDSDVDVASGDVKESVDDPEKPADTTPVGGEGKASSKEESAPEPPEERPDTVVDGFDFAESIPE